MVGIHVPAKIVVDRDLGIPLPHGVGVAHVPEPREGLRDLDLEAERDRDRAPRLQGPGQIHPHDRFLHRDRRGYAVGRDRIDRHPAALTRAREAERIVLAPALSLTAEDRMRTAERVRIRVEIDGRKERVRAAPVGDRGAPREAVAKRIEGHVDSVPEARNRGRARVRWSEEAEEDEKQSRRAEAQTVASSVAAKLAARTPSPSSACGVAEATRTGIKSPTLSPRCGNTVVLKCADFPNHSNGFRRVGPSTSTWAMDPMSAWFLRREVPFCSSIRSVMRRVFSSSSTVSGHSAERAPDRGEYLKTKALSNPIRRIATRVASKSSAVSPGKPTMMSVESATPGTARRILPTSAVYSSIV